MFGTSRSSQGNLLLAREGDLFVIDIPVSSLWHGRLGHLSKTDISFLSKAGYIPKLSFTDH
jgi:hypothetical protein